MKRIITFFAAVIVLAITVLALREHTRNITYEAIVGAIKSTPSDQIYLSLAATIISFFMLAIHEVIAAKVTTAKLSWKAPALAGSIGHALSNTLGFHAVTLSAWRYRIYTAKQVGLGDIARISSVASVGMALGFSGFMDVALLLDHIQNHIAEGVVLLLLIAGFVWWGSFKQRKLRIQSWTFVLPEKKITLAQIVIGIIEMSAAAFSAYILLPAEMNIGFAHFGVCYIGATLFGIVSHAPGGLGVFEATMMTMLGGWDKTNILAALLLYRIIYNLLPFTIACTALAIYEVRNQFDKG